MHNHSHDYEKGNDLTVNRLIYSILLNALITVSEIIGGILSSSLSLISDALHNLTDTFAMGISLFARIISKKSSSPTKTFGYKRAEIIAAFININALIVISLVLFKEAIVRLLNPVTINGSLMFIIAIIGLIGNLLSAILLYKSSKDNINVKSAFIHILSDAFSSIGVIIAGILIIVLKWYFLDAILTFLIGTYVLIQSWKMLMEVIHILMQGAPADIDINRVKERVEKLEDVKDIHHIHIWSLTEELVYFEAHVSIEAHSLENMERIKSEIKSLLKQEYDITHSTIEIEICECASNHILEE